MIEQLLTITSQDWNQRFNKSNCMV